MPNAMYLLKPMPVGALAHGELIVHSRSIKNTNLETAISVKRNSLQTAIHGEGMEVYSFGPERRLKCDDKTEMIVQSFKLILTKEMTRSEVGEIVYPIESRVLLFTRC